MVVKSLYKNEAFEWIDIQDMKYENISEISKQYKINIFYLKDCINANHLPKAEDSGEIKFILTRMSSEPGNKFLNSINDISTKVGIFIKENLVLTIHRVDNERIEKLSEELQNGTFQAANPYRRALELGLGILKSYRKENINLLEKMEKIENDIFINTDSSSKEIKRLYRLKRRASLNLKLLSISKEWVYFYKKLPIGKIEFNDLKDTYTEVMSGFEHLNSQSTNLISMFLALSDQRNNESMKILAVYSAYFLPITFLASLYGMNFQEMFGIDHEYGFYWMLGIMVVIVIVTSIFMKRKNVK